MRVAMYYSNSDVRLEELPPLKISDDEVLMQVKASGICGSDIMEWYRRDKVPLVLGHEVAGVVSRVGGRVKNFKVGDRVVTTHHVPCGKCEFCKNDHETVCDRLRKTHFDPGGFSEFVRLPVENVRLGTFKVPKNVTFEEATFVEPLGCVIRGQRLAGMKKGKRVLVVGSGMAGLLHIKLAKYLQAKTIFATDIDRFRLKKAKQFGADFVVDANCDVPSEVKKCNGGRLADFVAICSGAPCAMRQGLQSVERGGTILIFTAAKKDSCLPVSTNEIFWRNEVTVMSSYAASPGDLKEALRLISQKKITVQDMITHRLPLEDIQKGFDLVVKPVESIKVIINP